MRLRVMQRRRGSGVREARAVRDRAKVDAGATAPSAKKDAADAGAEKSRRARRELPPTRTREDQLRSK